jgi:AcrR family transcriptional regulator
VELLDAHGERGFTFKLLTERLRTGAGAVYWHVANKGELVLLATDRVIGGTLTTGGDGDAEARLRALALAVYDTLEEHPWAAPHVIAFHPMTNVLRLLDRIGRLITEMAVPAERHFTVATVIFNYLTSLTAQDFSRATTVDPAQSRDDLLAQEAQQWAALDTDAFPFLTRIAGDLRAHDDRDQFVAGFDLLLAGLRGQVAS